VVSELKVRKGTGPRSLPNREGTELEADSLVNLRVRNPWDKNTSEHKHL
jgi:hypothetical protein